MKYIIYTKSFDLNSGGVIVLHQLCHLLNKSGEKAFLWDGYTPEFDIKKPLKSIEKILRYKRKKFKTNKYFNTPLASIQDLDNSVVIYPEVVNANPLNAKNIVRWLLHKPGFHTGKVNFTKNELFFGYGEVCSGSNIIINENNSLVIKYIMSDIYKQKNFSKRKGVCYMIRKGKNKKFIHDEDAINVDGCSHEELAVAFNKYEKFISYDTYTYYSVYASLCGCDSIVVPDDGVSKEEWYPQEENRYGLAYGLNDVEYARKTLPLMKEYIIKQDKQNLKSVKSFVQRCEDRFS